MESKTNNLGIPVAIVIAGAFIAAALYFGGGTFGNVAPNAPQPQAAIDEGATLDEMRAISAGDHVRGDPNAPVKIVEYSDFECPFCKRFHFTMQEIVKEYDGKVAWVYRQFPLDQLHTKARKEAVASECANELGGNEAFWKFADRFFELTPSNDQTDIATILPQIAKEIGLDVGAFNTCLASGKYDAHIEEDVQNAVASGGRGTPWSIVVTKSGKKYPLSGAQPIENVRALIDTALESQ
jgi:protein-disulfide isomerase